MKKQCQLVEKLRFLATVSGMCFLLLFSTASLFGSEKKSNDEKTQASSRASAYYHFSQARLLEENGDFLKAIEEYKKAVQQDPKSSNLYIELANAYLRHRRVRDAIQEAENAVRIDGDNLEAHRLLGSIYYQIIRNEESSRQAGSSEYLKKAIQEYEVICRLDPNDTSSLLILSLLHRYDGHPEKAIESANRLLGIAPSSESGLTTLAQIYTDQGNTSEAINVFKRALEVNPNSPRILEQMAFAYLQLKDYKSSVETYRKALALDEDNLDLRKGLAYTLFEDNQNGPAEEEFLKILEADPDDGNSHFRLGQIYRKRKDYDKSLTELTKASSVLVGNLEVSFHLATLYEELGKFEKAEERFQQLLKLTEKPAGTHSAGEIQNRTIFLTHAGYICEQLEKYSQAITYFSEVKSLSPDSAMKADSYVIDTYRSAKQLDKALAAAEKGLKDYPNDNDFKMLYADVLAESGKSSEGIKILQEMLTGKEEDSKIYAAMVQVYQRDKRFKDAEKLLLNSEKYFKNKDAYNFILGSIYEREKEYEKAEMVFKKVLETSPNHAASLNYLGYMLADRGTRLEESLLMIKKAVELEPNNGAYLDSLGWAYFKLDRMEEAESYLKKAADRVRKDPTVHDHLGDLFYRKGQYEQARVSWELSLSFGQDEEEIKKVQKKVEELKIKLAQLEKK